MKLNNDIKITARNRDDENDITIEYDKNLTMAEIVTTLELAKQQVLEIGIGYVSGNNITKEEEIEAIYWEMKMVHLI